MLFKNTFFKSSEISILNIFGSCRGNVRYSAYYYIDSRSSFCDFTMMKSIIEFQLYLGRFRMVDHLLMYWCFFYKIIDTASKSHTIMNAELEANFYLTFSLTYRRFPNYKLQQFFEKFQFLLRRFRMVSLLFMHCYFFYEIIDTASSHSSR